MSIFGLWLEQLVGEVKVNYYLHQCGKYAAKAVKSDQKEDAESKKDSEPEVVKEETSLTEQVWDEVEKKFQKTEANDETIFADVFTGPATPFNQKEIFTMSNDQLANFIQRSLEELKPEKGDKETYKVVILCILFLTGIITIEQYFNEISGAKADVNEKFNSVYKFFTKYSMFTECSVYELSEVISYEKLLNIMKLLNDQAFMNANYTFGIALKKAKEAYVEDKVKQNTNNGATEVNYSEIVTPFIFNHALLSQIDMQTCNVPIPEIEPRLKNQVIQKFKKALNIDENNKEVELDLIGAKCQNPKCQGFGLDTGRAYLIIKNATNGQIYHQLEVDLGTMGHGICVVVDAFDEACGMFHKALVSVDTEAAIIRKAVAYPNKFVLGTGVSNHEEYETVMMQLLPLELYTYFDFSRMGLAISKMNTKQKTDFVNLLYNVIHQINWAAILGLGYQCPRFRFRDFVNATKFTLISDDDVRIQDPDIMAAPWQCVGKCYFANGIENTSNIIVQIEGNSYDLYIDGEKIEF